MTYDITSILEAVIALIGVIFTAIIIPLIRTKTTVSQQEKINQWIKIAVLAAEQIFVGSGRGAEKKQYVLEFLEKHKIKLDEEKINALIEAAVYELNSGLIK